MNRRIQSIFVLLVLLSLLLGGCGRKGKTPSDADTAAPSANTQEVRDAFDEFTDELFAEVVSTDALTLHYELADPSNSQQVTYDLLDEYYRTSEEIDAEKYFYFSEPLTVPSGQHSLLPILMAEYSFYDKEDVENYITLLQDFPSYFRQIIAYEKAKSDAGMFMSDTLADSVIEGCETFIEDPENNALIEVFPEKLQDLPDLTDAEIKDYTERNQKAVLESVIPAYQELIEGITALKGTGTNELGLCNFKNGKEFYSLLGAQESGTGLSPSRVSTCFMKAKFMSLL